MHPLLNALNLDHPGLENAKSAVDSGNTSQALDAIIAYYRNRQEPDPEILAQPDADAADSVKEALAHAFVFYNEPGTVPGNGMDWTWRPGIDREWTWALNRHGWWSTLASAYLATREENYIQELDMLIRTWVGGHPPTVEDQSAWRTIEAGIRTMRPWPSILSAMKASNISRDAWLYYLRSIYDHAEFLLAHPKGGNWLLMETNGVLTCGLVFPEFKRAAEWVKIAIEKFETEMQRQVHPDGAQVEYSTGYQFVCIHNFEAVLDKTDRAPGLDFSQEYRNRLIAMYEYVMYMMRPDGKLPMLNDADQRSVDVRLIEADQKFNRPDFLYAATHGEQGEAPTDVSHRFPWVRRAIMRSDWGPDAFYAMLETAPFGYGHQHEDALTFELMAYGQPLIGTMGRYTYARVPERQYLTSSRGHNVVLIDGQEQAMRSVKSDSRYNTTWLATKPTTAPWISTPDLDVACGRFKGPWTGNLKNITWDRWLAFHKPDPKQKRPGFWVVRDTISGKGEHALDFLLHFYPGEIAWNDEIGKIITDYGPDRANMVVKISEPNGMDIDAVKGQKGPARGWFSEEYGKIEPAYEAAIHRQTELPFTQTMVFVPFRDDIPEIAVSAAADSVDVVIDGQTWPVSF